MKLDLDLTEVEWKFVGWCIILAMSIITGVGISRSARYLARTEKDIDKELFNKKLDPIFDLLDKSEVNSYN